MAYADQFQKRLRAQSFLRTVVMRYRSARLDPSDVILGCYLKSGSTWLRFMVADLLGGSPDFDSISQQLPELGYHDLPSALRLPAGGRLIKSHDPATRMSSAARNALVMVRDGRDVAVSYYFYSQRTQGYSGSFQQFLQLFVEGKLDGYTPWHQNVMSWFTPRGERRHQLVVRYEDLLTRGSSELGRIADWLELDVAAADLERVYNAHAPEQMRALEGKATIFTDHHDPSVPLVRSAQSGEWQQYFDTGMLRYFEDRAGAALKRLGYPLDSA